MMFLFTEVQAIIREVTFAPDPIKMRFFNENSWSEIS